MYEVRVLPPAAKFIKKIKDKNLKSRIIGALNEIAEDPYIGEAKMGDLQGVFCYDVYYSKTKYEIVYSITELPDKIVIVILTGTRENFYEQLKRYL
jgi:mRNA-degrading endonuclease RelE of RelBE toxin-antitoxin system